MTLEQLRIFVAVAEKQHVTRAANELNLTQSATSAAIAALEARYGIKLFDRIGRGIALTQTGKDFLIEARAVLARAADATQVLNDLAGLKRGSLSIAASQTVGSSGVVHSTRCLLCAGMFTKSPGFISIVSFSKRSLAVPLSNTTHSCRS